MTSSRPYLLRAIHEWIVDNGLTPYLLVDAANDDTVVPREHVQDGRIILNIAPPAVHGLVIGNDGIFFGARFGGRPMEVSVPVNRVLAIYARENGQGMMFGEESGAPDGGPPESPGPDKPKARPSLKVVK